MTECTHSSDNLSAPAHSSDNITLPTDWSCSYEQVDGFDRCLFHLPPSKREEAGVAELDIERAAQELITDPERDSKLIGAELPGLDVSDSVITGKPDDKLDIRFSTITGELNFENTRVDIPVAAEGCIINRSIKFTNAIFQNKVNFYGARFKGASDNKGVHFRDTAVFARILSSYSLKLRDSTVFEQTAVFSHFKIKGARGSLELRRISANGPFYCREIDVPRLNCREAIFKGIVGMNGAQIRGDALFGKAHFHALARFGDGDRTWTDDRTEIDGRTEFTAVLADQTVGFESVKFNGDIDLRNSLFDRSLEFILVSFNGDLDLHGASFNGPLIIKPLYASSESEYPTITGSETSILSGTLAQPGHSSSDPIRYDIVDSIMGDVSFFTPDVSGKPYDLDNYSYRKSDFDHVRFLRTKFEGFDFTSYRNAFEGHWKLHRFANSSTESGLDKDPNPSDLELTYMYAKQGADNIGDNLAASKFFQYEMDHRLERYQEKSENTVHQYLALRLWKIINYTESPLRVFGLGVGTTVLFAGVYLLISELLGMGSPYSEAPLGIGYFIFSGESFISLVHAPGTPVTDWPLRFLSVFEGFVGAFIIALFVFSLTRAVHR